MLGRNQNWTRKSSSLYWYIWRRLHGSNIVYLRYPLSWCIFLFLLLTILSLDRCLNIYIKVQRRLLEIYRALGTWYYSTCTMYSTVYLYVGVYFVCTNLYINSLLCTILYIHECSVHCVLLLYIYVQMVLFSIFMYGLYTSYLFTGGTVQKCPARVVLCTVLCICVQVL